MLEKEVLFPKYHWEHLKGAGLRAEVLAFIGEQICPAKRFACPREARVRTKVEQAGVGTSP